MVIYDCGYILKNFINKGKRHMDYEKKKKYKYMGNLDGSEYYKREDIKYQNKKYLSTLFMQMNEGSMGKVGIDNYFSLKEYNKCIKPPVLNNYSDFVEHALNSAISLNRGSYVHSFIVNGISEDLQNEIYKEAEEHQDILEQYLNISLIRKGVTIGVIDRVLNEDEYSPMFFDFAGEKSDRVEGCLDFYGEFIHTYLDELCSPDNDLLYCMKAYVPSPAKIKNMIRKMKRKEIDSVIPYFYLFISFVYLLPWNNVLDSEAYDAELEKSACLEWLWECYLKYYTFDKIKIESRKEKIVFAAQEVIELAACIVTGENTPNGLGILSPKKYIYEVFKKFVCYCNEKKPILKYFFKQYGEVLDKEIEGLKEEANERIEELEALWGDKAGEQVESIGDYIWDNLNSNICISNTEFDGYASQYVLMMFQNRKGMKEGKYKTESTLNWEMKAITEMMMYEMFFPLWMKEDMQEVKKTNFTLKNIFKEIYEQFEECFKEFLEWKGKKLLNGNWEGKGIRAAKARIRCVFRQVKHNVPEGEKLFQKREIEQESQVEYFNYIITMVFCMLLKDMEYWNYWAFIFTVEAIWGIYVQRGKQGRRAGVGDIRKFQHNIESYMSDIRYFYYDNLFHSIISVDEQSSLFTDIGEDGTKRFVPDKKKVLLELYRYLWKLQRTENEFLFSEEKDTVNTVLGERLSYYDKSELHFRQKHLFPEDVSKYNE